MSASQTARLDVGIIGAGRVGPVIGHALAQAGHFVTGITARSDDARDRVDAVLGAVPVLPADEVARSCSLLVIAVADDALPELVRGLAEVGAISPGQIVLHTSAAHGVEVLAPAAMRGAIPIAMHPAMVFSGTSIDRNRLASSDTWFGITCPAPVEPIAQALVLEMGGEPLIVAERDRPAYAEAMATASEFSARIIEQSLDLLKSIGVDEPGRVLGGVARTAVENALARAQHPSAEPAAEDATQ